MIQRQEFTARVKAFTCDRSALQHRILVDECDAVLVFDTIAGHYTVNHALSVPTQNRLRHRAQELRR